MIPKNRVGNDGELLTPQPVPQPKRMRAVWQRYFWLPLIGWGQLLATYAISSLVSVHSALYGLIMAISIVVFHFTLMIWINWTRLPSRRRKKGTKSQRSEKIQLPPGVTVLDSQRWYQEYSWWMRIVGFTLVSGILGLLFMLWITPISVFNTPIREIYTRGIPLQTTLEKFCRDEVAYGRNSRQVSYYHVFFYTTPYDLPNATEHMGKEYMSESECHSVPAGAPIYIHYLPENPSVYRVVAGAYQPYDPKT